MANYLSPFANRQFIDANGKPYSGAKLFTYISGSTTKVTTYKDSAGSSSHTNPIILNTRGESADGSGVTYPIWQIGGSAVKFVLAPSTDTDPPGSPIVTWDNISGVNDTSITIDQWIAGNTPTYINTTQFTLIGDQTSILHIGRRVKASVTAGTVYGTITTTAYTTLTTVTLFFDSGVLDAGLSAISYGILTSTYPSIPGIQLNGLNWTHQGSISISGTFQSSVTMASKAVNEAKGAAIASVAGTTDIWTPADGNTLHITGIAAITSFGTAPQAGSIRRIVADGAFSLITGANLICPANANITCAVNDAFIVYADTTTKMYILNYHRYDGTALAVSGRSYIFNVPGTYTNGFSIPSTRIWVTLIGGGGGGGDGGSATAFGGGGGGSGGGINSFMINGLIIGNMLDVIVGAAGVGGVIAGAAGGAGGTSSATIGGGGATYISSSGGGGGQGGATGTGGTAGSASAAAVTGTAGNGTGALGGDGGASIFGLGGLGGGGAGGLPGTSSYGAGGGGGWIGGSTAVGGNGRGGIVIFQW